MSNPDDDPKMRFAMARVLAKEYIAKADAVVATMDRMRFRAHRYLAIAHEAMLEAEEAAIEAAIAEGEEREIEREVWRGAKAN